MLRLLCVCVLLLLQLHCSEGLPVRSRLNVTTPPRYTVKYFQQDVDHFSYAESHGRWSEKYLLADEYWTGKGPLFFYSGNEGSIENFYDNSGFVFTLAEHFNALIVFAEHRFYGASLPFGKESFDPVAMDFLSVEQALADFAVLIGSLRQDYSGITKVISFGGSYGGMLSAWFRFKYPNVVDGALAASAPIYYIDNLSSNTGFYERVTQDFASVDGRCPQYVRKGFSMIMELAKTGTKGLAQITKEFQLCDPLQSDGVEHLVGWVKNSFASLAMTDYPYPASFLAPLPAYPVNASCHSLLSEPNRLRGLAQAAGLFYNGTGGKLRCFNITEEYIECADSTGCGTGPDALSWDYQACTEMYGPSDTNNVTDMFPPSIFDPTGHCMNKWKVQPRPGWMTTQFWGKDISSATNIIFSNGDRDPWSTGGVTKDLSDSLIAIVIKGGAHHLDLRAPNTMDPPSVVAARAMERDIIGTWIE